MQAAAALSQHHPLLYNLKVVRQREFALQAILDVEHRDLGFTSQAVISTSLMYSLCR